MTPFEKHLADSEVKINIPCPRCQPGVPVSGLKPGYVKVTEFDIGHERGAVNSIPVVTSVFNARIAGSGFKANHLTKIGDHHWFEIEAEPKPETKAEEPTQAA